jgi:ketosteroid isomerase-like protein
MLTPEDLARRFHAALTAGDWTALRSSLTDDARWVLPGDNAISGTAEGGDAVVARAQLIASYGVSFKLNHILLSRTNMALSLHNTAERNGRYLDEHLATVCRLRDGRIFEIETFLSDIQGMNLFFNQAPS